MQITAQTDLESTREARAREGQYLSFHLGDEEYGLEILKVHEIIGMTRVTQVPRVPDYVRGVINLRGKVIPVIDLRLKFGMAFRDYTEKNCIIIIQVNGATGMETMGIIVDNVHEVIDIAQKQIEATPNFGHCSCMEFILGIAKLDQRVVMLLDIDSVLTGDTGLLLEMTQAA